MQFTSLAYLGFFAAVFAVHWASPARWRWAVCLAASVGFCALFGWQTPAFLALCAAICYFGGLWLSGRRGKKGALALCIGAVLLPLLFFKYFDVLLGAYVSAPLRDFSLMMPVGISFFTFKAVAYLADVYSGKAAACRHFGRLALYLAFFPQVSMGPIQRPDDLLRQIDAPRAFDAQQALAGAQLMLWGYFEKLVVADNLPYFISYGYGNAGQMTGGALFIATLLYSLRLYADFAGYSHIAIGCMQLLGFSCPDNFRSPYWSASVRDFWNRWHISLSSWLRDYIYIPLGGSRHGEARACLALMLTFFISGLWHGVGMQFVVWGLLHGFYMVAGRLTRPARERLWRASPVPRESIPGKAVRVIITLALVWVGWVFFSADSVSHAWEILTRIAGDFPRSLQALKDGAIMLEMNSTIFIRTILFSLLFFLVDFAARREGISAWLPRQRRWIRLALCYLAVAAILFGAPYGGLETPIYFQF